jgi:NAD(P)H dehydrogenase (quinone)
VTPTQETEVLALEPPARIAVIYYSATGNVHGMARAVADGASRAGAEVRLRHVAELRDEMLISVGQYWGAPSLRGRG